MGWGKNPDRDKGTRELLNWMSGNGGNRHIRVAEKSGIISPISPTELNCIKPGLVYSAQLVPPQRQGDRYVANIAGWNNHEGCVMPYSEYYGQAPQAGNWHRLVVSGGPFEVNPEGQRATPYFDAIIFRDLEPSEDKSNPHILLPNQFYFLKDIARGEKRDYSIQDATVKLDLFVLRQLERKGLLINRRRKK